MAVVKTILGNAGVSSSASICGSTVLGLAAYGIAEQTLRHSCLVIKKRLADIVISIVITIVFIKITRLRMGVLVYVSHTHTNSLRPDRGGPG